MTSDGPVFVRHHFEPSEEEEEEEEEEHDFFPKPAVTVPYIPTASVSS